MSCLHTPEPAANQVSLVPPGSEMLAVCANCQKQFVNVVMRENSFDKQLKVGWNRSEGECDWAS